MESLRSKMKTRPDPNKKFSQMKQTQIDPSNLLLKTVFNTGDRNYLEFASTRMNCLLDL